jgi:hypothetical protein
VLDVPDVRNTLAVDPLEAIGRWVHGGAACRWARFVLAWIQRAYPESVTPTCGGLFAETTRTRHRVDLWLLGEIRIRTFYNSPPSADMGAYVACATSHS